MDNPVTHPALDSTIVPTVQESPSSKTDPFMEELLGKYPQYFDSLLRNKDLFKIQIIYTQIDRGANNNPHFKNYFYNVNAQNYFYPASTVKMPTALLALQKLNELKIDGLTKNTTMITERGYSGQTPAYNDPSTIDGRPSIGQYVRKIFLVSDNEAFNRLYEFLGQGYINDQLHKMGYDDAAILHRLEVSLTEDENRHTNPVQFRDQNNKTIYEQPMQFNESAFANRQDSVGKGYYKQGQLIEGAMNFSAKNRLPLEDLHNILKSIIFPQAVSGKQRFNITKEDYQFVRKYMSELPGESTYPPYDTSYHDAYCKFILLGSDKQAKLPDSTRIFNKVGDAYGFLIDVAYVADFKNKVEFMVSAVIYCNSDGILNDDKYDYDNVGYPFMKHLGEVLYQYELNRSKKHLPDLSEFQMNYDGE